jgi:hypothetical protein
MAISLTVHKNKVEARRKRELSKCLTAQVERLVRNEDIRAFAVVGINAGGKAFALWDTGAVLPRWAFADTVATVLRKDIEDNSEAEDDWRPSLTLKGSR